MSSLLDALAVSSPRIEEVALAIAEDAHPGLDRRRHLASLDRWADQLRPRLEGAETVRELSSILTEYVYGELGFRGNEDDYYDPRNSYLNEVLDRRLGIPITLAVVLMALGRRASLRIEGIGFPGHFLVRVGGREGLYLDPFHMGRVLEQEDLRDMARRFDDADRGVSGRHLRPVGARAMATRMLLNLQRVYERRGDRPRAMVVCDRLVDVTGAALHRRDRGVHALTLGAAAAAVTDLEAYLEGRPRAHDRDRIESLLEEARAAATTSAN